MNFKHKLVIVKFSLSNRWIQTFKELIHNEGLSAAGIAPEINALQPWNIWILALLEDLLRNSQWVLGFWGFIFTRGVRWADGSTLREKAWEVSLDAYLLIACVRLSSRIRDTSDLPYNFKAFSIISYPSIFIFVLYQLRTCLMNLSRVVF